jgi:hypothetical protein
MHIALCEYCCSGKEVYAKKCKHCKKIDESLGFILKRPKHWLKMATYILM